MARIAALVASGLAASCAIHLRAEAPEPGPARALAPKASPSHVAVVGRLRHSQLGSIFDRLQMQPVVVGQQVSLAGWKVGVERAGKAAVGASNDDLCLRQSYVAIGEVMIADKRVEHRARGTVAVCSRPVLTEDGMLRLGAPRANVQIERRMVLRRTEVVRQQLERILRERFASRLAAAVGAAAIPVAEVLGPIQRGLAAPIALPGGACLRLRPDQFRVARAEVDPSAIRLTASVRTHPAVQRPCAGPADKTAAPQIILVSDLRHPPTLLRLPVSVPVSELGAALSRKLRDAGRLTTRTGWLEILNATVVASDAAILARLSVRGQTRTSLLGLQWKRDVRGELLLWGRPELGPTHLGVQSLQVAAQSDEVLAEFGAALRRAGLIESVAARLRWTRASLTKRALAMIDGVARPLRVGREPMPVRVDTNKIAPVGIRASGGRLVFDFDFEGTVVVGDTRRR